MGKITSLFHRMLAAMPFGRKKAASDDTSETESSPGDDKVQETQDETKTLVSAKRTPALEEETDDHDATETKPGLWRRIAARIKQPFSRRNRVNVDEEPNEDTASSSALQKPSAREEIIEEGLSDAAPKKRRIPMKKLIIIGLPVLAIVLIASVATAMIIRSNIKHQEDAALEDKHQKALEAEFKKLQEKNNALLQENKKLRSSPAQPALAPDITTPDTALKTSSDAPHENPAPIPNNSKPPASIGDCAVTNKESAGESLKRCIEAYNTAVGRN